MAAFLTASFGPTHSSGFKQDALLKGKLSFHSDSVGVDLRFFPCHACLILGWD